MDAIIENLTEEEVAKILSDEIIRRNKVYNGDSGGIDCNVLLLTGIHNNNASFIGAKVTLTNFVRRK